jgi:hypothetical protein
MDFAEILLSKIPYSWWTSLFPLLTRAMLKLKNSKKKLKNCDVKKKSSQKTED